MIIFIIYLLILTQFLHASFEPTSTETFIKPAIKLKETKDKKQNAFIGFVGNPGNYKKAQMFNINKSNGDIQENENFTFNLSPSETSTFFSAHTGSFTGPDKEELAIIVSSSTVGTKVYLWERTEGGFFKRTYAEPTTINKQQPSSQPLESITTNKNKKQNNITLSFGSPNRNIVILDFEKDKININKNIASEFLQNQAGTIFIREFLQPQTTNPSLYVFNVGSPKESITIKEQTTTKKTYDFDGLVNDLYTKTLSSETKKIFLISGSTLFFPKTDQNIKIGTDKKYVKIVLEKDNHIWLLDEQGTLCQFKINLKEKTLEEKGTQPPPHQQPQKQTTHIEFLYDENTVLVSTQTATQNTITQFSLEQQNEEEKQQVKTDTLNTTTNIEKTIPILLNENLNFIKLITIEQPKEMELDLTNMSYIWTPSSEEAGFHNLEYNIIYNKPGKITKEKNEEGKTNLNKLNEEKNTTHRFKIFVNDPPKIETGESFSVTSGHELKIQIKTSDKNKNQKIKTTFLPPITGAEIKGNTFFWKPTKKQQGPHQIEFIANDGISSNSSNTHILVDTTTQTTKHLQEFVLTVNKEFTLKLQEEKKYLKFNENSGPENIWISKAGKLHWIPIETQLGYNEISIERIGKDTRDNIIISTFVNSPPIISYRPDNIEYINIEEEFIFNLQAFDANDDQNIFWLLNAGPEGMSLNKENQLLYTGNNIDYNTYIIEVTDSIDTDVFYGQIYVNDIAKIISAPPKVIQLGEELNYSIEVEDRNKQNPTNKEKTNTFIHSVIKGPTKLSLINNRLKWKPTKEDIGDHDIQIHITNGIDELEHSFHLYVNEAPKIISTNKLKVMAGDTLTHLITANDKTNKNELTFSIRTIIEDMYLNASTGKIHWVPKKEDIGTHIVEVAVSDGFEKSDDIQEIEIIVQGYPNFLSTPPTEGYVGLEYRYYIEAQNAQEQKNPKQDFFVEIEETTFSNMELDTTNYIILSTPKLEDAGKQNIKLKLSDNENNQTVKIFEVLVLETSPCETDTLIIKEEINKKQNNETNQMKPKNRKPPLFKIPS